MKIKFILCVLFSIFAFSQASPARIEYNFTPKTIHLYGKLLNGLKKPLTFEDFLKRNYNAPCLNFIKTQVVLDEYWKKLTKLNKKNSEAITEFRNSFEPEANGYIIKNTPKKYFSPIG